VQECYCCWVHDPDNSAIIASSQGLPADKVFWKIPYQWIAVTHLLLQHPPFSSFVVPDPDMRGYLGTVS
jgi:hypothetical protein